MADGKIRIETKLDNTGIPKDLKELKKMVEEGGENVTNEFAYKVKDLENKWVGLKNKQDETNTSIEEYKKNLSEITDLQAKLKNLKIGIAIDQENIASLEADYKANPTSSAQKSLNDMKKDVAETNSAITEIEKKLSKLGSNIKLEQKLTGAEQKASDLGVKLEKVGLDALRLKATTDTVPESIKKASDESSKLAKGMESVNRGASKIGSSLSDGLKKIAKYTLMLVGVRTVYRSITQLSSTWLQNGTALANQTRANLDYMKNALANSIGPLVQWVTNLFAQIMVYVAGLIKALTGVDIFAQATSNANKNLASGVKSAKEINKQLSGFDEMNVLSDNSNNSGGGSGSGADITTPNIDISGVDAFAKKVKDILASLGGQLKPFFDTINAINWAPMQKAFGELKTVAITTFEIIGSSAIRIMNNSIGPFIKLLSEDLIPKGLNTVARVLDRLNPTIDKLLKKFVEPLFDWFLMKFVPYGLRNIYSALELIGTLLAIVTEVALLFWETIGQPVALGVWESIEFLFGGLRDVIDWLTEGLNLFLTALREGEPLATAIAGAIGLVTAGLLAYKTIQLAVNAAVGTFAALNSVNPFAWVVIAIVAIIAILYQLKENWDDVVAFFKEKIQAVKDWFNDLCTNISKWFSDVWSSLTTGVSNAIGFVKTKIEDFGATISNICNAVATRFNEVWANLKTGATNALTGIKNTFTSIPTWFRDKFSEAWTNVKNVFSSGGKIFDGIKDGILDALKSIINKIIEGINKVIKIPFDGINNALTKVKNVSILGAKPFNGLVNTITIPQIPRLATGTYATSPMFAEIGERGREAVIPLENNTQWAKDFLNVLEGYGGFNNSSSAPININLVVDGKVLAKVIHKEEEKETFRGNGRLVYG